MPVPYIHFTDTCRDAMTFYQSVFGGELKMMGFGEMPDAPPEFVNSTRVMHATLTTDKGPLMASDAFPDGENPPQASLSISWDVTSFDEGQKIYDALMTDGGAVTMPYEETFFAKGFGMVKDRFGTHWMIMAYMPEA